MNVRIVLALFLPFITVGCGGGGSSTGELPSGPDRLPATFELATVTESEILTDYTSDTVLISGINEAVTLSVNGCAYALNGSDEYTIEPAQVEAGDGINFQMQSSASHGVELVCSINIGEFETEYRVETKAYSASATFYNSYEYGETRIPALISKVFVHDRNGDNLEEITSYEGNAVHFSRPIPFSFSVYFELTDNDGDYHQLLTVNDVTDGSEYFVGRYDSPKEPENECRDLVVSREALPAPFYSVDSNTSLRASALNFCDPPTYASSRSATLPLSLSAQVDSAVSDDLLIYVLDSNDNNLGYAFFSSSDYLDSGKLDLLALRTDFRSVVVKNSVYEYTSLTVTASSTNEGDTTFNVGSYNFTADVSEGVMNLIDFGADKYFVSQWSMIFSEPFQFVSRKQGYDEPPLEIDADAELTPFSFIESTLDSNIHIRWLAGDENSYDAQVVRIDGFTGNGEGFSWMVFEDNSNEVLLPYLDGIEYPDYSLGGTVGISLITLSEDPNEETVQFGSAEISCQNNFCRANAGAE